MKSSDALTEAVNDAERAIEEALALLSDVRPTTPGAPKRPALTVIKGGMA